LQLNLAIQKLIPLITTHEDFNILPPDVIWLRTGLMLFRYLLNFSDVKLDGDVDKNSLDYIPSFTIHSPALVEPFR